MLEPRVFLQATCSLATEGLLKDTINPSESSAPKLEEIQPTLELVIRKPWRAFAGFQNELVIIGWRIQNLAGYNGFCKNSCSKTHVM